MDKTTIEKFFINYKYPEEVKRRRDYTKQLIEKLGLKKQINRVIKNFIKMAKRNTFNEKIISDFLPFALASTIQSKIEEARSLELLKLDFNKNDIKMIIYSTTDQELSNIVRRPVERSWELFYWESLSEEERISWKPVIEKEIEKQTETYLESTKTILKKYETSETKEKFLNDILWLPLILEEASRQYYQYGKELKETKKRLLKQKDPETYAIYRKIIGMKKFLPRMPWTREQLANHFKVKFESFNSWCKKNKKEVRTIKKEFTKQEYLKLIENLPPRPGLNISIK